MTNVEVAIIGAGPTGIGAAWRLQELGHQDWLLLEASAHAGGLASSVTDEAGFTWDLGGHVLFSHYRYFDSLMDAALGDQWVEHEREAWVRIRERWIPYPLQNNLWRLPEADLTACLDGLFELRHQPPIERGSLRSFEDWLLATFGRGLCDTFMLPYNFKVWAYPPSHLDTGWMGERVAPVDLQKVIRQLIRREDDIGWGPNATFRFPLHGGTGAIWTSLAAQLPPANQQFGTRVVSINSRRRTLTTEDGRVIGYRHLISTMPQDRLIQVLEDPGPLEGFADRFVHSSTHIVGLGMAGSVPDALATKCWIYFPEPSSPFYRATVFSNYSPNNVPQPGRQWALMAEVSESPHKPVDPETLMTETIAGFHRSGLLTPTDRIVSRWQRRLEYGYPTPWLGRDEVIDSVREVLESQGIYSRGRFGTWKYEVSNQDHSVMQGVETVGRILRGTEEFTIHGDMRDWIPRTD